MAVPYDRDDDVFAPGGHIREDLFSDEAIYALARCLDFASSTKWDSVRSPHVFMGLLDCGDLGVQQWAERLGADVPRLIEQFEELFLHELGDDNALLRLHREFFSDNVIRLLRDAVDRAEDHLRDQVTPLDILITMFTTPNSIVAECFERIGITAARMTELAVLAEQTVGRSI
jgi:ATP-dependent Clp protease ATP-binding subunit ClpA